MPTQATPDPKARIRAEAERLGFDVVGFARPAVPSSRSAAFRDFIARGRHGEMDWLARNTERRESPVGLWPDVRSVIVAGMTYASTEDPLSTLGQAEVGTVSVYARGRDYHDVLKKRLKRLGRWIATEYECEVKVFVDTAPVLEKPLAEAAGVGWQGKHTNLVSRDHGSWLFLGEIFSTLVLQPDAAETDHCGSCRRCLDVCPTGAFPKPYELDARRCISYLTIEHRSQIPRAFRRAIGNRIYGCDDCLAVCPWNKFAEASHEQQLAARDDLKAPALAELAALDDAAFRLRFSGSPIKRTGRDRFVRNALVAIGNSGERGLVPAAENLLDDPSALVRGMAVWALGRLLDRARFAHLARERTEAEPDAEVRAEWRHGLGAECER